MARTVGVLGLQGDFAKHIHSLNRLHVPTKVVRWPDDLSGCDALILPGGESTTFTNLMQKTGLFESIQVFGRTKPMFGTCAGLIVLAKEVLGASINPLGLIDIQVERNAYGRQVDSFSDSIDVSPIFKDNPVLDAVFIRAPKITNFGCDVHVLGTHGNDTVLARNENVLVATFHPELTRDVRIHQYFLDQF